MSSPYVSIVIPVYNEEALLRSALDELRSDLAARFDWTYEILVAENGSTDATVAIAEEIAAADPRVRVLSVGEPNYGLALRRGILAARGEYVLCDEIDLCDTDFYARALPILEAGEADLVVGSKSMPGAQDERPVLRRVATRVINGMLRVAVGFEGTDTHGLKAMRRAALAPVAEACVVDKDLFASELVVRAWRGGVRVVEIPVRVAEKRRPAINLARRVPNVLKNLARLTYVIRFGGGR
ncbi:MAG: glycosyltransferase [Deltaproteobacteria bacterium]|nr:MAG: glycosyltransferase [Deltaproteobacteria bacterium]